MRLDGRKVEQERRPTQRINQHSVFARNPPPHRGRQVGKVGSVPFVTHCLSMQAVDCGLDHFGATNDQRVSGLLPIFILNSSPGTEVSQKRLLGESQGRNPDQFRAACRVLLQLPNGAVGNHAIRRHHDSVGLLSMRLLAGGLMANAHMLAARPILRAGRNLDEHGLDVLAQLAENRRCAHVLPVVRESRYEKLTALTRLQGRQITGREEARYAIFQKGFRKGLAPDDSNKVKRSLEAALFRRHVLSPLERTLRTTRVKHFHRSSKYANGNSPGGSYSEHCARAWKAR